MAGNQLYVNRGIGFSRLPVRINCRPELTLFTFRPAGVPRRLRLRPVHGALLLVLLLIAGLGAAGFFEKGHETATAAATLRA